jgi:hypothetical protein
VQSWKPLALGILLLGAAAATVVPVMRPDARSVRVVDVSPRGAVAHFDRRQSAALFVGVRRFTAGQVEDVPYAVDDAVDLAWVFALDRRVNLVTPRRVLLALSGRPAKAESQRRLRELRAAGARVEAAEPSQILSGLREQAALAGPAGILIVSLATHGFVREGIPYILGASSLLRAPETTLSAPKLFDLIASSRAQRSIVFVDACRERIVSGTRAVAADAMSAAPLARRMTHARGQVVYYAAAAGQWAYDDRQSRNGVFTKAVIDGLHCGAAKVRGAVTAETLATYVERSVRAWIHDNRDPNVGSATQADIDGDARNLPLAQCWMPSGSATGPAQVAVDGNVVNALSEKNDSLWHHDAGTPVTRASVADLEADGTNEVVVVTAGGVAALDSEGNPLWSARENMSLADVATGDLFRQHTTEVVAAWNDAHSTASRLTIYAPDGSRLASLDHEGHFDHVAIWQPTRRHAPKIVATSGNTLLVFDPKKIAAGKPVWSGRITPRRETIRKLAIRDYDGDGRSDVSLVTASGAEVVVDFTGRALHSQKHAHFERVSLRQRRE